MAKIIPLKAQQSPKSLMFLQENFWKKIGQELRLIYMTLKTGGKKQKKNLDRPCKTFWGRGLPAMLEGRSRTT